MNGQGRHAVLMRGLADGRCWLSSMSEVNPWIVLFHSQGRQTRQRDRTGRGGPRVANGLWQASRLPRQRQTPEPPDRGIGAERRERRAALDCPGGPPGAQRRGGAGHSESVQRPASARQAGTGRRRPRRVNFGDQSMVTLSFYFYGDQSTGVRETSLWQASIQERFPMPSEPSESE